MKFLAELIEASDAAGEDATGRSAWAESEYQKAYWQGYAEASKRFADMARRFASEALASKTETAE